MEKVRIQGEDLLEAALRLYRSNSAYFHLCGTEDLTKEVLIKDQKSLPPGVRQEQKQFFLYYDQDEPLALVDLITAFPDEDTFYLGLLLIDGKRHRKKYGSMVYGMIEEEMKSLGFRRGKLGVLDNNPKALLFWESMGYHRIKKVRSRMRAEEDCSVFVMEKDLS